MNIAFGLMPFEEILAISAILAFITALAYRILINQGETRKLKDEMKFYQDKIKKAQKDGNTEAVSKLSTELLKLSSRQFRMSMKPLLLSGVLFMLVIGWMSANYADALITAPFAIPFITAESKMTWIWWYIIIIFAGNLLFRKLLGVE